jgi:hypothetical protein
MHGRHAVVPRVGQRVPIRVQGVMGGAHIRGLREELGSGTPHNSPPTKTKYKHR